MLREKLTREFFRRKLQKGNYPRYPPSKISIPLSMIDSRIYLHYSRNLDNPSSISASLFNTRFDNIVTRCGKFRAANRDRAKPCTAHSCARKPHEIVPVKFEIPRRNVNRGESKMPIRRYYVTRPVLSCGHTQRRPTSSHCNQSPLHTHTAIH